MPLRVKTVQGGRGTVHVHNDEGAKVAAAIDGGGAVRVPVDDSGGAAQVQDDDSLAVQVPVEEGGTVPADEEEGGGVVPTLVNKEAEGLKMMMTKPERFAHGGESGIA